MAPRYILSVGISFLLMLSAAAQQTSQRQTIPEMWKHEHNAVPCGDSPIPGRRPANWDCAVLARRQFSSLPSGALVLRIESFPTREAAEPATTPASVVVEAVGKAWLLTLASKGERAQGGQFMTEVGPITIPSAGSYEMIVSEADIGSEINSLPLQHKHSGPEVWYLFSGEQCVELPDRVVRARAGEGVFAPAETPMKLNIVGKSKRDALFIVVHDPAQPWNTYVDWQPKGLCQGK
jgi:mannose-6-phosphate isomerase-like protein (cupin superfamily)